MPKASFNPQLALQLRKRKEERKEPDKRLSAAEIRSRIDPEENLLNIRLLIARLEISGTLQEVFDGETQTWQTERMADENIPAVTAALNARFKLLDKVLPSLQSIEHTGEVKTGLQDLLALAAQRQQEARDRAIEGEIVQDTGGGSLSFL